MKVCFLSLLMCLLPMLLPASTPIKLRLPYHEQLSSYKIVYVLQDAEGFLWYATDGNGLCRDDGRQVLTFRSDAKRQHLLGSNHVICLAETGHNILIGTTHGANVLDKRNYSIRPLTEVDDYRVDDIIVAANGHWWLTANKKVFEYSAAGKLLRTLHTGHKYIFRLHVDGKGRLWATQWEGGQLLLHGNHFIQVTAKWPQQVDFHRVTVDRHGRQLVADGWGNCYVLSHKQQSRWWRRQILTQEEADSVRTTWRLSTRPTAFAASTAKVIWFSTGKDIRRKEQGKTETVISNTKDVSAMTFTPDGTLWMATIYGQLYSYSNGKIATDAYGSNEYGDAVTAMDAYADGRLLLASNRYVRIYNPRRQTMRQQSREQTGVYAIELQETSPHSRWSSPHKKVADVQPNGHISSWLWCLCALLAAAVTGLAIHNVSLRRQRRRFLLQMKRSVALNVERTSSQDSSHQQSPCTEDEAWLQRAIAQVEAHMANEGYSVEQLSHDMCMSRMTLYRKIQSMTGQTPTAFMRTIRLRHAAALLREGRLNVTEISYATGFSSVSYFSRCFRAMFGVPPTQYQGDADVT